MEDNEAKPEKGIDQPDVLDKYKVAGTIVDKAIDVVRKAMYAGVKVATVCQLGDTVINNACSTVFSKARTDTGEKLEKGVAFPTCVCVNNCASHFCPIATDAEAGVTLSSGDVVTVQMGAHIDGYCAMAAQTMAVREGKEASVPVLDGKRADAIAAAYAAADAALRVMRPGNGNGEVSHVIGRVAEDFGVSVLEGVLSHEMKRYVVDGSKVIMNRPTIETRVDEWTFEPYEVYCLDVVMSTGEGKAIERDTRETVYKRQVDVDYKLKMKTSRQVFSEINRQFPTMPFTLRALEDPKRARMAMTEIMKHSLVTSYPVLYERDEETVARCSMTVLITPNQTMVVTKSVRPEVKTEGEVKDEGVKALLAMSLDQRKKKKKNKKKAAAAAAAAASAAGGSRDGQNNGDGDAMDT